MCARQEAARTEDLSDRRLHTIFGLVAKIYPFLFFSVFLFPFSSLKMSLLLWLACHLCYALYCGAIVFAMYERCC